MSTPTLCEFDPNDVAWQFKALKKINQFNYNEGTHEVLLSGSAGSAKSLLLAHLIVVHCLENKNAHVLIGRASMPHLRDTLFQTILDHLDNDVQYEVNLSRCSITFPNKSKISSWSWSDKKYKKVRSYALSMAVVEELTENAQWEFYKELKMRVGRLPKIKKSLIVCATNPDSPSHWAYKYFISKPHPMRHVFYSLTEDNKFLPETYVQGIKETLAPKEIRRMLYGEWIEITSDVIYYNYSQEKNLKREQFEVDLNYPIDLMFDFNIGQGKPMSAAFGQYIKGIFYSYKSYIVHGADTNEILEEINSSGLFKLRGKFRVFGDASGRNKDTRSNNTDYTIIEAFLKRQNVQYEMCVPRANPPIRDRHNYANGAFCNSEKQIKFFCYDTKIDEGLRLTKLRKGSDYLEDDTFEYQHVTTAITYWIYYITRNMINHNKTRTIQL